MDVRSLATGKLLATWTLGVLKPAEEPHDVTNPGMSEVTEDENRIGLTGEARAAFIKSAIDACNKSGNSAPPTYCSCYANAMADSVSIKELKETSAPGNSRGGNDRVAAENRRSRKTLPDKLTPTPLHFWSRIQSTTQELASRARTNGGSDLKRDDCRL